MAERKLLYKVSTKRDKNMVKDFILFTYRVSHPKVTRNFIIVGLVSFALTYGLQISAIKYFLWFQGTFCILMGLFRHWIPISRMMRSDPDIREENTLSYEFDSKEIKAYRNGELFLTIDNYKNVHNLYHDEGYYFLGANEDDLLILPKSSFERGDFEEFKTFIEKKAGIETKWSPSTGREKKKKKKVDDAIRLQKVNEARELRMAEIEERNVRIRKAIEKRNAEKKAAKEAASKSDE